MLRILVRGGLATLWPWLILAISFAVNLAFFAAAGDSPVVVRQSGGLLSLFLTSVVANQQAWTQVLPFVIGQSGTRRGFVAGMGLFVLLQAAAAGFLVVSLGAVEARTGGWGMDVRFFRTPVLDAATPLGQFAIVTAVLLAMSGLGAVLGAVLVRWGSSGVWWLIAGVSLTVGGLTVVLLTRVGLGRMVEGVASRPWPEVWLLWPLTATAVCAFVSWLTARRVALR